jgi:hypothetical protein
MRKIDQDLHMSNIKKVAKKTNYNRQQFQNETVKLKGKKRLHSIPLDLIDDSDVTL